MALVSVTPISGSLVSTGQIITVVADESSTLVYRASTGSSEIALVAANGTYEPGYTGSVTIAGDYTYAFRRDAGWANSPFTLTVTDGSTGAVVSTINYTLLAEGQYPSNMQPFNTPALGTLQVTEDDVLVENRTGIIDFDDATFRVTNPSDGKVRVVAELPAGSGDVVSTETAGTVVDTEIALFDGTTGKIIKGGHAQIAGSDLANSSLTIGAVLATNGILSVEGFKPTVFVDEGTGPFWAGGAPSGAGQFWVKEGNTAPTSAHNKPYYTDDNGDDHDLSLGGGDVISSESSGTVDDEELAVYDTTSGKLIKGGGATIVDGMGGTRILTVDLLTATEGLVTIEGLHPTIVVGDSTGPFIGTPTSGSGQHWVKDAATAPATTYNRPYFTDENGDDYDLTAAGGGINDLDSVINFVSADNDVNVPLTDPVILRDGGNLITPLSIVKLAGSPEALTIETASAGSVGLRVKNTADADRYTLLKAAQLSFATPDAGTAFIDAQDNLLIEAGDNLALYSDGADITLGIGGGSPTNQIEFAQGITVGETADHPVAPAAGKGQYWVNEAGAPIFTSASDASVDPGTDYDLTTASPLTLDQVITVAPVDNALTVPSGNPIIFTDGSVAGLSPLTISKTATSTAIPALAIDTPAGSGLKITNSSTSDTASYEAYGFYTEGGTNLTVGGGAAPTGAPGTLSIVGAVAVDDVKGGLVEITGGESTGTDSDGGDVEIGAALSSGGSGVDGDVRIGYLNGSPSTHEIVFSQGITIMEASSQPISGAQAGKGQFWVNDNTSPNKPYYTDEDGASFDLTTGSGVGDVTATASLPDNALVRGDVEDKGVQASAASTLSDVGDLLIENDITAGNDVISTNDVTSTVDVNVGADLNIPDGDIIVGATHTVDGRFVAADGGVLDGHVGATSGNPHDVEGLEVLSTGQAEFLVLTADGLDGTTWSSAGVGNVISDLDITDHTIVRGDGGVKGIQESGIAISDTDNITGVVDLTLTGDITSTGEASFTAATAGVSVINIDNGTDAYATALRPDGLVFAEGGATELGYSLVVGPKNDAAKADAITIEAGANAGAGDGGDILINAGNGAGAGTDGDILLGTLFTTNSVVLASTGITTTVSGPLTAEEGVGVTGDITVTGSIDGIADLNTDVTANTDHTGGDGSDHQDVADNTTHRGLTSDNPHGTSLENLVSGTHAQLNIAAADAGNIFASAVRNQVSSLDAMPTGTPAAGDLIAVEDISEPGGGKWKYVEASEFLASTAPTITDFTNAGHDHADAAGGGTIAYGDITGTPTAPTLTKSITIEDPAADEDISMFFTTVAITVTQITAVIVGSTSVSFDIEHGTSRATPTGTGVIGTDEVADSTTTGNITTSFTDETIPENSFVWLTTSNLSGTPTELNVTIEYTED